MSFFRVGSSPRLRSLAAVVSAGALVWACADGNGVSDAGRSAELDVRPSFQVVGGGFDTDPIDRIRLTARDASTDEVVGTFDGEVDPAAQEWVISLVVDVGEGEIDVVVDVELLSGTSVEWSGVAGPATVRAGSVDAPLPVTLFPGPLDNREVEAIELVEVPDALLAGDSADVIAQATLAAGSTADPVLFWTTDDPAVATVSGRGLTPTVVAVAAGRAEITAVAAAVTASFFVDVVPTVQSVVVTPATVELQSLDATATFAATVTNGFGIEDARIPVTWSSAAPAVATVDDAGLATAVGFGTTTITARAAGVSGTATLTVNGPDLRPTWFLVAPDAAPRIADLALTGFSATILNEGPVDAPATTAYVLISDAATGAEVHPPLSFAVPAIPAGGEGGFDEVGGTQIQPVTLPDSLRFEVVADGPGEVPELDETDNGLVERVIRVQQDAPPGFDLVWDGISDAWEDPANWNLLRVPTAGDAVYVPATGVDPLVSDIAQTGALTVAAGATVQVADGATLEVAGDLDAGQTIAGLGTVVLLGAPMTVQGSIEAAASVTGDVDVAGPTTFGTLAIGPGGRLGVGPNAVDVLGGLTVNGGALELLDGAGSVDVTGGAGLTAGSVEVFGSLTVQGDIAANAGFGIYVDGTLTAAQCTDLGAVVAGRGAQPCAASPWTRIWSAPGPGAETWSDDLLWRPRGAPIASDDVLVPAGRAVPTLSGVAGVRDLSVEAGASVDLAGWTLSAGRDVAVDGALTNGTLEAAGGGAFYGTLDAIVVTGDVTLTGDLTAGDVAVDGTLSTGAAFDASLTGAVTVAGQLSVLVGRTVDVTGTITLEAGSTLLVDGTLTATGGCTNLGATLLGTGTSPCGSPLFGKTWVGGAAGAPTDWATAANWAPVGVPVATDDVVIGPTANDPVLAGTGMLTDLTIETGATLEITEGGALQVSGALDAGQTITGLGGVILVGTAATVQGDVQTVLVVAGDASVAGALTVADLAITTGILDVGPHTVTVTGDLSVGGGSLEILDPAGLVAVEGGVGLTSGTVEVDGSLTVAGDIVAGLDFFIWVDGTITAASCTDAGAIIVGRGTQPCTPATWTRVWFVFAPATGTWDAPDNWRPRSVPVATDRVVVPEGTGAAVLTGDVEVLGLTVDPGTTVDLNGLTLSVAADVENFGDVANGTVDVAGPGELFGIFDQVLVSGAAALTDSMVASDLTIDGSLNTTASDVTLSGTLDVNGTLTVPAGTRVDATGAMTLAATGTLAVDGVVTAASCTNLGGVIVGSGTTPCGTPQFTKIWVGGAAGGATDWSNADNWTPVGVPTSTDDVLVDETADAPALTADGDAGSLVVATTASLDLGTHALTVQGDLSAIGPVTNGTVVIAGPGSVLRGTVPSLELDNSRNLSEALTVTGGLTTRQTLEIGAVAVTVAGDFLTSTANGRLIQRTAGSTLEVAGSATFDGASTAGWLTVGALRVGGDLTAAATHSTSSFVSTGSHLVELDGSGPQAVTLSSPGPTLQRFRDLTVSNAAGTVTLAQDTWIDGAAVFATASDVNAPGLTLTVGGSFADSSGVIDVAELATSGDLTEISSPLNADVRVGSFLSVPNDLVVNGDVRLDSNALELGAHTLTVRDSLTVRGASGQLRMRTAGGVLDVAGSAVFDGATTAGWLTEGTLRVGGDFTATATSASSFVGTGAHTTVLDGVGAQIVTFSTPGTTTQRFGNLTVENIGATVTFGTTVVVDGAASFVDGATVTASTIRPRTAYDDPGGGVTLAELATWGDLTAISSPLNADLTVGSSLTLPNDLVVNGDVRLASTPLEVGPYALTVADSFTVRGASGQLRMRTAAGVLDVNGSAVFDGATTAGWMTQGTLRVAGNLTAAATSSPSSFAPTVAHTTVLDGTAAQTVALSSPGRTAQRFDNLTVSNASALVTLASPVTVADTASFGDGSSVAASVIEVGGAYIDPGGGVALDSLVAYGDLAEISSPLNADLRVDATLNLPNDLVVNGDVRLDDNDLEVHAFTLTVRDSLTVRGGGAQLVMRTVGGVVDVNGSAHFDGANVFGWMTEGTLRVAGDLTAAATSSGTSFAGSVGHETVLDGTGPQTVSFAMPGPTTQRFRDLTVTNSTSPVTFASVVSVSDTASFGDGTTVTASTIWVGGAWLDPGVGVTMDELVVYGDLRAMSSPINADVRIDATLNLPSSVTINGDLRLNNNDLEVHADTLQVSDSLTVRGGAAQLVMRTPAGVVGVDGSVLFAGGVSAGWLTAGELYVGGDFNATSAASPVSFAPDPTHTTFLDGTAPQTVTFSVPGRTTQRFGDLRIVNADGLVTFASPVTVADTLSVGDGGAVAATEIEVAGAYLDPGLGVTLDELVTYGDLLAISSPLNADLSVEATLTVPNALVVNGDVRLNNNDLEVTTFPLTVADSLTARGGSAQLVMRTGGALLDVNGPLLMDGGTTLGWLTAGTLRVAGDVVAEGTSSPTSFAPTGAHLTVLDGAAAQTLTFSTPATTAQRFHDLTVSNASAGGVTSATDFVATGDVQIDATSALSVGANTMTASTSVFDDGTFTVPGGGTADIATDLVLAAGSTLDVDGTVTVGGTCTNNGATILGTGTHPCGAGPTGELLTWVGGDANGPTDWDVAGNWSPAQVPTAADSVLIPDTTDKPVLAGPETVAGITIEVGGSLDLNLNALEVAGNMTALGPLFNGTTRLTGDGALVRGSTDILTVETGVTLSGDLIVLTVADVDASVVVGPHYFDIRGALNVTPTGVLVMQDAAGTVGVVGDATFTDSSTGGAMTAGVLLLEGDLLTPGTSSTAFVASPGHITRFTGGEVQFVTLDASGAASNRLGRLEIADGSTVSLAADVYTTGDTEVLGNLDVQADVLLDIQGTLILQGGSTMNVDGAVTAAGGCTDNGAVITGQGPHPCG